MSDAVLDDERADAALDELKLPRGARASLLQLVNLYATAGDGADPTPAAPAAQPNKSAEENVDRIVMASYHQIRVSFWISAVMSVVLFVAGLTFLALAVAQAKQGDRTATIAIAGVGLADFLLLFYTNPRRDLAKNLASTQRVHIVATSYLFGMGLAARHDDHALRLLHELTVDSVRLLDGAGPADDPADPDAP
ncbi:MAG: hypothetical protein ACXWCE_20630 [Caldimonas sp.]